MKQLSTEDLDEVFELLRVIYEKQDPEHPMGGGWSRSMIRDELTRGEGQGFFDASGYLRGVVLYRTLPGPVREISVLGSHPQWRGQGVMSQILKYLQLKPNEGPLWLEVHENNLPARRLYEKLGFEKTAERPGYYRDGGTAILYSLGPGQPN